MGYIKHHSIVVTSFMEELIQEAHDQAKDIFKGRVSEIVQSEVNCYKSFFIAPDGSKEGWKSSDEGDEQRVAFVNYINSKSYKDGSNSLSFCEFFYGEDNGKCEIVNHN